MLLLIVYLNTMLYKYRTREQKLSYHRCKKVKLDRIQSITKRRQKKQIYFKQNKLNRKMNDTGHGQNENNVRHGSHNYFHQKTTQKSMQK